MAEPPPRRPDRINPPPRRPNRIKPPPRRPNRIKPPHDTLGTGAGVVDPRRGGAGRWRVGAAAGATGCAAAGAVAVSVAVVAGPGPGLTGYVSEAGVAASGYAAAYRIGVFGLAVALLLLAAALPRPLRAAAGLLGGGAAGAALSGAVTCSAGCPLPPFEAATTADLVHGGASIAAVACCVFAMLVLAVPPARPPAGSIGRPDAGPVGRLERPPAGPVRWPAAEVLERQPAGLVGWLAAVVGGLPVAPARVGRLATLAAFLALPLSALVGLAMLGLGRGTVVGVLERLLLLVVVLWVAGTGLALLRPDAPDTAA
nr:DUF998 domain-containing protein [Micromonospora sp. DSM 115978]